MDLTSRVQKEGREIGELADFRRLIGIFGHLGLYTVSKVSRRETERNLRGIVKQFHLSFQGVSYIIDRDRRGKRRN